MKRPADLLDLRIAFDGAREAWIAETARYSLTRNTETRLWKELLAARRDYVMRLSQAPGEDMRRVALYFREEEP